MQELGIAVDIDQRDVRHELSDQGFGLFAARTTLSRVEDNLSVIPLRGFETHQWNTLLRFVEAVCQPFERDRYGCL